MIENVQPCESGACINVLCEEDLVHISSTQTGQSMTATKTEWDAFVATFKSARAEVSDGR